MTSERTRVVVDPIMLDRLKQTSSPARLSEEPYHLPHFLTGWPIFLDPNLGDERGAIIYADGRVEKFGRWPNDAETYSNTFSNVDTARASRESLERAIDFMKHAHERMLSPNRPLPISPADAAAVLAYEDELAKEKS
ncbi:MAG TPA: hypothetical protein VGH28_10475 [Polyangiaceae bacterium]|jgi:hypothetical protein